MDLWARYKRFIISNPRIASEAHLSLSGIAYLVLDLNSTLQFESVRSAEHLVELLNRGILERHTGSTPPHHCGVLSVLMKVIGILELPTEILVSSRFPRAHFPMLVSLEAFKTLIKLWRLYRSRRMRIRFDTPATAGASDPRGPSSGEGSALSRRRTAAAAAVLQHPLTVPRLVGELLHTLRPITYASLLWRMGTKSWIPLLVALGLDVLSFPLCRDVSSASPSRQEATELSSRIRGLGNYLFRDPLFGTLFRPTAERVRSFLESKRNASVVERMVYGLVRGILEYILTLQRHYFYSADSS